MASVNKVIFIGSLSKNQIDAFWSKVNIKDDNNQCWEWLGAKKPTGYGNVRINNKYYLAHRVAFELSTTKIPRELIVCHICDNPKCCNPSHLMLGTNASNVCDMVKKNRQQFSKNKAIGERNFNSKLTGSDVIQIRNFYDKRVMNQQALAEKYSVSQPTIGYITRRVTWRHI